jgi:hypothetical protein
MAHRTGDGDDDRGWDDAEIDRAPICPVCGVTALPAEPAEHGDRAPFDTTFVCENPDCDAYGDVV